MLINPLYREVIENHPDIDGILELKDFKTTLSYIKKEKFNCSIHLFPTFKTSLMTFLSGIPQRIGTGYRIYSFLYNKKIYMHRKTCEFHEAEYNVLLLKKAGFDIPFIKPKIYLNEKEREKIKENFKNFKKPFICIHPESRGSAPNWSFDNYKKLIEILDIKGTVFITGLKKNFEIKERENIIDLRGKLNLREFINFVSFCDLVFAPSTGVIHIASALNVKVVTIFSEKIPFTPKRWGPLGKSKILTVPDENLDKISVEKVKKEIESFL